MTPIADRGSAASDDLSAAAGGAPNRLRRRIHEILDVRAAGDQTARVVEYGLIVMILANVGAIILESMPAVDAAYQLAFDIFEAISIIVFTVEYGLRVWSSVENPKLRRGKLSPRLNYVLSPISLVDLVAIVPFYLSFLIPLDLRFMRVFRLFLVLKLSRYQASMTLLWAVLRHEARPIAAALFVLTILLIVVSSFAYLTEGPVQPEDFGSIPDAMYWAIVTMTTVGYGDVVPITPLGKLLGAIIGVIGVGMVALPAGLLASGFSQQLHERRREFEDAVNRVLENGVISPEEGDQLKELREELGLTDHQAAELTRLVARRRSLDGVVCPHCGKPIDRGPHADEA
ncbi:MAG: ion transporter [Pseudomonadota bacterium]